MNTNPEAKNESTELLQLVSFKIANEEFGIDILNVQEINKMTQVTKVPNSPEFVEGVINLRGRVIPVVNLRVKMDLPNREYDKDTRIIVVDLTGKTVGFLVDSVSEVLRIPRNIMEPPPSIVAGINSNYITAVGKLEDRLLILLDLDKILHQEEKEVLETVN
ncbi:MAG: chemotaxis protein CheW [Ignavibacteriales bacterium]|nr:chemotaxis protein CheW [Ignavibacteriales bacterium]